MTQMCTDAGRSSNSEGLTLLSGWISRSPVMKGRLKVRFHGKLEAISRLQRMSAPRHSCARRNRPTAAIHRPVKMLRCGPSNLPFAAGAISQG